MADIIDTVINAGELPSKLRGGLNDDARVVVSVRPLTGNGFSEAFEDGVLEAERTVENTQFKPARLAISELTALAGDES